MDREGIDRSIVLNSLEDMERKYPMGREGLTLEEKKEFISDFYDLYEKEGFSKVFVDQIGEFEKYDNKPFTVIGRTLLEELDLKDVLHELPAWDIKFEDGYEISAFPDEIIDSEIKRVMGISEKEFKEI